MAKIKRLGVIKMASFMGLYTAFMGFVLVLLMLIVWTTVVSMLDPGTQMLMGFFSVGWLSLLTIPLIYGVIGFLSGLIFTPIMNLVLKIVNGIDLDIQMQTA